MEQPILVSGKMTCSMVKAKKTGQTEANTMVAIALEKNMAKEFTGGLMARFTMVYG